MLGHTRSSSLQQYDVAGVGTSVGIFETVVCIQTEQTSILSPDHVTVKSKELFIWPFKGFARA